MNIKEEFYKIDHTHITQEYIESIKIEKNGLSNSDKKFLLSIIGKFKEQEIEKTLRAIKMYAIWEPDEAILESRKKGVFRYKAYDFKRNKALYLIKNLINNKNIYLFSTETIGYLMDKKNLRWIYDFYKESQEKLVQLIKEYHSKRIRIKNGNQTAETAIFKDLLAYIDACFYTVSHTGKNYNNKNILDAYSKEEICEGISYIVYLYDSVIGIKQDISYFTDSKYVISTEIEDTILIACKVNQLEEWELYIDYFDYKFKVLGNEWIIFDKSEVLEKSIRMGYVRNEMQTEVFFNASVDKLKDVVSISEVGDYIEKKLGDMITKEILDGKLSRYRFEFPEPIFSVFEKKGLYGTGWFKEEISNIEYCAKELIMSFDEVTQKKITENCNLIDIIIFQRLFILLNEITSKILFKKEDKCKVISSLIPSFQKDILIELLDKFINNKVKVQELLNLFTYNKDRKLDLQYTPFLCVSGGIIFSNTLVAKSNLLRNAIAYSYLSKNQIANDNQGIEPLVQECSNVFKVCKEKYNICINKKYKYMKKAGEIDVIVSSDLDIIIIECKCPLSPINNFEMRSNLEHIEKANRQLNLSKEAFSNKEFRKIYFKAWGIEDKNQNIRTCIIFGNRLFTGYNKYPHPIRYIYELDMVLNKGIIYSELGDWRVWKGKTFSHNDLLDFLSEDKSFVRFNFESMDERHETMCVKQKKLTFETYAYNVDKCLHIYNSNLKVVSSNNE
ncbi:MAG: hypothetical protein ACERKV_10850 [Clostridiaceae bacterium]